MNHSSSPSESMLTGTSVSGITVGGASQLQRLLFNVRRRLLLIDLMKGLAWALLAAVVTILTGMWLDLVWELTPEIRLAVWGCASVVLLAVFGLILSWTWKSMRADLLTRRIDTASQSGGQVLNGYEFATVQDGPATQTESAHANSLTRGLADMAVARAAQLSEQVRPKAVISRRPAVIAGRTLAIVLAGITLLVFTCPTLAKVEWQRFLHPWDETPPYSLYVINVEPGDTSVIYGQGLEVRVSVTGQLARNVELVTITDGNAEKAPMFPEANGTWRTQLSRLTKETTYYARVDRARSQAYRITIITTPSIEDVQFTVTPPAYTHDMPTSGPLPKSGLVGLAGTLVKVTARSNRPLSSGEIRLKSDADLKVVSMQPAQPGDTIVVGEFAIAHSAKLELRVIDTDDQPSQEPFVGSVTLLVDQRPLIRILEPKPQSLATPTSTLPIILDAEDDFGLSRLELYRSLNESRPTSVSIPVPSPSPRRFRDHQYLPLARYDLQPGDEIKLFARVTDNEPDNPKGAESTVVTVRIISQEEFEHMQRTREGMEVLLSKYRQAERRLESLAEEIARIQKELKDADPDSPLAKELQERLEKLSKEMREEAEAITKAAEHDLPYDIDEKMRSKLKELAQEIDQMADELQRLALRSREDPTANNEEIKKQLEKLAEQLAQKKERFEQEVTEPLELLAKVLPLKEDESRFTALVLWQIDLANRLAAFKGIEQSDQPEAKARLRDLQEEQRKIREELAKLLEDIENHVQQLPEDEQFDKLRQTALKFVADVRDSGASEEMVSAESVLTDFRGDKGYGHALEAAEILKKFLKQCEGMGEEGGSCLAFNPSLSSGLGDSIEQLLADAGLSQGNGGAGKGGRGRGGYSMRSGNSKVGLYGGTPSMSAGSGNSGTGSSTAGKVASGTNSSADDSTDSNSITAPWKRSASSANTGALPPQYRRRVNQYFHKVATELEQAGK